MLDGRYRLVSLIGEGGMGKVYKAHDATLDRSVAIKILPPELVADPARVNRLIQEARAASALNHPNVLTVYDIGAADEMRYIAMELVDGKTVREQMLSGPYDLRKSLKVVLQVAEALTAAHGASIVPGPRATARRRWLLPALLVIAVALAAAAWISRTSRPLPSPAVRDELRITRVTASGKVIAAAISRDGTFVAYNVSDQGEQSLWVRQMSSGQSLELIPMRREAYWGLSFSPDGDIFFGLKSVDTSGAIYRISPLGGVPRKIISNIESPPTFSPDGKRMAFLRAGFPAPDQSAIVVANIDGTDEKTLAAVTLPDLFVPVFFGGASWSPDGRQIATALINRRQRSARVIGVDVSTGAIATIGEGPWVHAAQVAWLPDGSGLVAIAAAAEDPRNQVWHIPYPTGTPTRITKDLFDYRIVSLTADGKSLVTVASDAAADLWIVRDGASPRKITHAKLEGGYGITGLSDGRVAVTSLETGKLDIWAMKPDGGGRVLLTRDEHENRGPVGSPDGQFIVYVSITSTGNQLCRMNVDGSNRRVLATGIDPNVRASISPDSQWVLYDRPRGGRFELARVSIHGGPSQFLTDYGAHGASYSPDGSQIAAYVGEFGKTALGIISAEGGRPVKRFEFAPPTATSRVTWARDGSALIVNTAPSDRANLWRIPIDESPPVRITNFDEHLLMAYAPLPDGKGWLLSRGDLSRDAVLITGFAPR